VIGSTDDPKVGSYGWRQLWEQYFGSATGTICTSDGFPGTFPCSAPPLVGGHLVLGSVPTAVRPGGSCYIMPICKAHNNKSKAGQYMQCVKHTQAVVLQNFMNKGGKASKLVFSQLPSSRVTSGAKWPVQPQVFLEDAAGVKSNTTGTAITLTLTGSTNPTLSGTTLLRTLNGWAPYVGLSCSTKGAGSVSATLTASSPGLVSCSVHITITG